MSHKYIFTLPGTPHIKLIYQCMVDHGDATGECRLSETEIAALCGCSVSMVQKVKQQLMERSLLRRVRRGVYRVDEKVGARQARAGEPQLEVVQA